MSGSDSFGSPGRAALVRTVVLLLVFLNGYATSQTSTKDYTNYTVYRVGLKTQGQIQSFLDYANQHALDIWRDPSTLAGSTTRDADIMVPPDKRIDFVNHMKAIGATVATFIPDVQRKINESSSAQLVSRRSGLDTLTDQKYFTFEEIEALLEDLRMMYPDLIQLIPIGTTFEGRQMKVVYLSSDHRKSKPAIWVDAGIHAREWIAPAVVLQAIHRLVTDPNAADMLRAVDWYLLPVFNPDGYEYSHKVDRMWRKTRSQRSNSKCYGVDANRNFDFYWKENGASSNPCSDTYAGPSSFSEPETINVKNFLLKNNQHIKAYLTYHSYGKYLLYPWGYTYELPVNSDELDKLARDVNKAMVKAGSQPYKIGSSTNVLYPAAGGSDDWAKGVANISLAYTIELPGFGFGFQLPPQYITPVSNHVFVGLREFAKYVSRNDTTSALPAVAVASAGYQPKPVSSSTPNRPISPQKPFFTPSNRPRPSRPQFTPANTFYVPQAYPNPYPYPYPYPSDVYHGFLQPRPSTKSPADGQQSENTNQHINPSVQSSGSSGVQDVPGASQPSLTGFKSFRRPASNQPARPASPTRDPGMTGSVANTPQNSRPSQMGMADPSSYSQGSQAPSQSGFSNQQNSRPASSQYESSGPSQSRPSSHYEPSAGSSQSQPPNHYEPAGRPSQSQPSQSQYESVGPKQPQSASSQFESSGPSQSRPASSQYDSAGPSISRPAANQPIDFGETAQSAGVQNQPVRMPSSGSQVNPAFGDVFDSNVPTSSEPYYEQPSGAFSFPASSGGLYRAETNPLNTGSVSFPSPQDETRPLYGVSNIGQAADLVSAMDSAPLWE